MKLEIGSGYHPDLSFDLHMDINPNCPHLEYVGSAEKLPWEDNTFDQIRAVDIIEHFSYRKTINVLKEWNRVLKVGGRIYIQCPNAKLIAKWWLNGTLTEIPGFPLDFSASYWICGGQEDGVFAKSTDDWRWNAHYILLSPESMEWYMKKAGFKDIDIRSDGGSNMMIWASK